MSDLCYTGERVDKRTLWWLGGIFVGEGDLELEEAAFPDCLLFAGDATVPFLEVHHAVAAAHGFCEEAEGMVASPLLAEGALVCR